MIKIINIIDISLCMHYNLQCGKVTKMKVDTDKIEWLLKNETQYKISKDTGVAQVTLSGLISGKRKIENLTVKVASKLTEYAEEIQNIK